MRSSRDLKQMNRYRRVSFSRKGVQRVGANWILNVMGSVSNDSTMVQSPNTID